LALSYFVHQQKRTLKKAEVIALKTVGNAFPPNGLKSIDKNVGLNDFLKISGF
jgi:peptidyl-tRNA hydrolase